MKINTSSIICGLPPLFIAAVLSVAVPSFAMPQTGGRDDAMRLQLGQLHDRLKLTEQQESLWTRAENASHDKMESQQAERKQAILEMKDALNKPQVDLRALSGKMDAYREKAEQESTAMRGSWLSFYDSLDARQREMTRRFLLKRIEHMEKVMVRRRSMGNEAPL